MFKHEMNELHIADAYIYTNTFVVIFNTQIQ